MDVVLSTPSPADAAEFIAAARASKSLHHPWINPPDTAERFAAYLARAARDDQASYLIRHSQCGALVGYVNVGNIVRGALQSGYVGYASFASHAGRGLMTAGLRSVIDACFTELGLHRLQADTLEHNVASQRVLERNGFVRIGHAPRYLRIAGRWQDCILHQLVSDT